MTKNQIESAYFDWMYQLIKCGRKSYQKLLKYLHNTEFTSDISMDDNRASDGIDLRYRFGYENGYEGCIIASCLDYKPCSVLEMIVALAIRYEEHIMDNPDIGDRTKKWFWGMIDNLGLSKMYDDNFDLYFVEKTILRFLNREYEPNGKGGLFTVKYKNRRDRDLRNVEIWYQMCWYLDGIL